MDHVQHTPPVAGAPRAWALASAIAFGSSGFAGCVEPVEPESDVLPVASTAPPVLEAEPDALGREAGAEPLEPELEGDESTLGFLDASPGFTPDPLTRRGATAGGALDAHEHDERCAGWITPRPDAILRAGRPFAELAVMAASREDVTLMVIGPDGDARCAASDGDGAAPVVRGLFARGAHRIWVGSRERDARARYVLALSELDDTRPRALLH